jgi:hypothetical protein
MKIAEALLLRKQLSQKVDQSRPVKMAGDQGAFELRTIRKKVTDDVDQVELTIPRITLADVTATFDFYATQLRKLDARIQEANWLNEIDFTEQTPPKPDGK